MNKKSSMTNNAGRRWFSDAVGGAWRLVKAGTKIRIGDEGDASFYAELRALSAAHMPVLTHKQAKYLGSADAPMNLRWFSELDDFVTHTIWPQLAGAAEATSKSDVIELLDKIIGAEQRRIAAMRLDDAIPHTSRFDTSWAS